MSQFTVRIVQTDADREGQLSLRYRVLREPLGLPRSAAAFAGDDAPEAVHLVAVTEAGEVIGCATLLRDTQGLQLRGMAVDERWQGRGVGGAVLEAIHAQALSQKLPLWCNARLSAAPFYEKHGWVAEEDIFDVPGIGAHVIMRWQG